MRGLVTRLFFPCALALGIVIPAHALRIAVQPPSPLRVAVADAVLIGRVVGLEDKDISVSAYPGAPPGAKATYRVAVVQVADVLKGDKALKTVRVGFFPPPMPVAPGGGPGRIRPGIRPGLPRVNLKAGDAGLFYLAKHFAEPLYLATGPYDVTARASSDFDKELNEARANLKLLDNPLAGLKSADKKTRFLTAALLISRYRTSRPGTTRTEPISAEESKLILTALAESDKWGTPPNFREPQHPQLLFGQLGVTQKDGFQPPAQFSLEAYATAIRAWLRANAGTYRIQRIVPADAAPPAPAPGPSTGR